MTTTSQQNFEYMTTPANEDHLTHMGKEGWRLIAIHTAPRLQGSEIPVNAYWERPAGALLASFSGRVESSQPNMDAVPKGIMPPEAALRSVYPSQDAHPMTAPYGQYAPPAPNLNDTKVDYSLLRVAPVGALDPDLRTLDKAPAAQLMPVPAPSGMLDSFTLACNASDNLTAEQCQELVLRYRKRYPTLYGTYSQFTDGLQAAAQICGSLAETEYDAGDEFKAATGCEYAINAVVKEQRAHQDGVEVSGYDFLLGLLPLNPLVEALRKRNWVAIPLEHARRFAGMDAVALSALQTGFWPSTTVDESNEPLEFETPVEDDMASQLTHVGVGDTVEVIDGPHAGVIGKLIFTTPDLKHGDVKSTSGSNITVSCKLSELQLFDGTLSYEDRAKRNGWTIATVTMAAEEIRVAYPPETLTGDLFRALDLDNGETLDIKGWLAEVNVEED